MSVEITTNPEIREYKVAHENDVLTIKFGQYPKENYTDPLKPPPYFITLTTSKIDEMNRIKAALGFNIPASPDLGNTHLESDLSTTFEIKQSRIALSHLHRFTLDLLGKLEASEIITTNEKYFIMTNEKKHTPPLIMPREWCL